MNGNIKAIKHLFWALGYVWLTFLMFWGAYIGLKESGYNHYLLLVIGCGCLTSFLVYINVKNFIWDWKT